MTDDKRTDQQLIEEIRAGDDNALAGLIARYEGRLLAFVARRVGSRADAEDIVQETFLGLWRSLDNFDTSRPLESFIFAIAAHRVIDHLRREGRRPTVQMIDGRAITSSGGTVECTDRGRAVSSLVRSTSRKSLEADALSRACEDQIEHWRRRGQWTRLMCIELLLLRGRTNKEAAAVLGVTQEAVASIKHDFVKRLQKTIRKLDLPETDFPELYGGE